MSWLRLKNARRAALLVFLTTGVFACGRGDALEVQYVSPEGAQQGLPSRVEVRLNKPVIDPDAVAPQAQGLRFTVEPPIAGSVAFPTPNTVQYHLGEVPLPAQTYTVTLHAGLRSADGTSVLKNARKFTFTTEINSITRLRRVEPVPADGPGEFPSLGHSGVRNMGLKDRLLLELRYPEKVERLRKLVKVKGKPMGGSTVTDLPVRLRFPEETLADKILIAPEGNWPKHTELTVQVGAGLGVAGLPAGSVTTPKPIHRGAATYGPLEITQGPACDDCRPPHTLQFVFTTPVSCAQLRPFVQINGVNRLGCVTGRPATVVHVEPQPPLSTHQTYTVQVRPGITDKFGQKLAAPHTFTLKTGSKLNRFAHQKMFTVMERKQGGAHVEQVYKTAQLQVEGVRLPFAKAWQLIQEEGLTEQVAWTHLPYWLSGYGYGYRNEASCNWDDELQQEVCDRRRSAPGAVLRRELNLEGAVTNTLALKGDQSWEQTQIPLDPYLSGKGGIVALQLTAISKAGKPEGNSALRLINYTDIGLSAKYSPGQLVVLVATLSGAEPIAGAEVEVYTGNFDEPVATGTTDATGVAIFSGGELQLQGGSLHGQAFAVVAKKDDDEAFMWSRFQTGGRRDYVSTGPTVVGSVYTERGVYRPGETVFFRAVLRTQTAGGFSAPTGSVNVKAKLGTYDEDEVLYEGAYDLSEFGTIHGQFVVPASARIGDYDLRVMLGDRQVRGRFKVAEFRRAEMKVQVGTDQSEYITGDELTARINADFLFGAPAAGLDLRWTLRRSWGHHQSRRFPQARFTDSSYHSWHDSSSTYTEFVDEGKVKLDDNGSYVLTRKLHTPGADGRTENLVVSATVEDESGQSVSARQTVRVHPASVHVGIIPRGYLKEKDQPFTFEVVAVTPTDEPAANVPVKVSLLQDYWTSIKRQGPGGRVYWDYKRHEIHKDGVCQGNTNTSGMLTCQFTPEKGGSIRLRAEGQDAQGRKVAASSWFWVTGDANYYGGRSSNNQVSIMSEAAELEAGKTATLALTSPFKKGLALITVEREDILWQQVMELGTSGKVEIPVPASWAPNVHVSATVVRGRVDPEDGLAPDPERDKPAYALGYTELKVKPTRSVLNVKVRSESPDYEPGDKVKAFVAVTDHAGNGTPAEVNLFAVDEGVLMLTGYKTPQLIGDLFRRRGYTVLALDTRMHVLGERRFITPVIKGEEDGGGGGEGDDEELREDFNPVAVWVGALKTDANGAATHEFEVPDTLTTYRLMAVAVTQDHRFGSGDSEFKVKKTLMMRQALPRFARPGDVVEAGVVVNQLSGKDQPVEVELVQVDEALFDVKGERKQRRPVGATATVPFRWTFTARDVDGEGEIIFSAKMGDKRDKVKLILPVKRLQAREAVSVAGVLAPGELTHTLALPELARPTELEVNLSGLPVASLEERMRNLVGYPYGCLEQRTAKILPLIAIRKLSEEMKLASIPAAQIKGWVDEFIGLVPKYRCHDDGYDYYPGCGNGSDAYLTAFLMEGLLTAKQFGYEVPDHLLNPAASYLETQLARGDRNGESLTRLSGALRVLALMGRSKPAFENVFYEARAKMPLFARTDLARAIYTRTQTADERVQTLLADFDASAVESNGHLRYRATDQERYWWAWDSDQRNTALVLRTLLEVVPSDSKVPLIVKGLVDLDGAVDYYTTQGTTQTLLALAEAVEVLKDAEQEPVASVSLTAPDQEGPQKLFEKVTITQNVESKRVPGEQLGQGPYQLAFANTGKGPLYFGGFLRYAYPATARLPAKASGFRIEREYTDRDGKAIGESVTVGDYVMVNLSIWVEEDGQMVVVDDPLPAGLEPVDTTLATSDTEMAKVMEGNQDWSWWRSRYKEMRDDRTEWHFRRLWRSYSNDYPLKLRYLTKASTAGSYYAPGTAVERIYQPHIRGRGPGRDLVVKPKPSTQ